jgi:hypothetical protein
MVYPFLITLIVPKKDKTLSTITFETWICHWVWHSTSVDITGKPVSIKFDKTTTSQVKKTVWWVPYILMWKICLRCHQLLWLLVRWILSCRLVLALSFLAYIVTVLYVRLTNHSLLLPNNIWMWEWTWIIVIITK